MPTHRRGNEHPALRRVRLAMARLQRQFDELSQCLGNLDHLPTEQPPPRLKDITATEYLVWRTVSDAPDEKYENFYEQLGMKKRTFDKHLNSLFAKLGVRTRSGATRMAVLWARGRAGEGGQV